MDGCFSSAATAAGRRAVGTSDKSLVDVIQPAPLRLSHDEAQRSAWELARQALAVDGMVAMSEQIASELDDRTAQRLKLEALFQSRPLQEIEPDELKAITPHYQQRLSESRRRGMRIVNVPRYILVNGRKKKQDGAYMLVTFTPLGRDARTFVPARAEETGPFQRDRFELKG